MDGLTRPELRSRIVEYEDRPNECTLYPADADPGELTTTWLTASEGTYLDATRCR